MVSDLSVDPWSTPSLLSGWLAVLHPDAGSTLSPGAEDMYLDSLTPWHHAKMLSIAQDVPVSDWEHMCDAVVKRMIKDTTSCVLTAISSRPLSSWVWSNAVARATSLDPAAVQSCWNLTPETDRPSVALSVAVSAVATLTENSVSQMPFPCPNREKILHGLVSDCTPHLPLNVVLDLLSHVLHAGGVMSGNSWRALCQHAKAQIQSSTDLPHDLNDQVDRCISTAMMLRIPVLAHDVVSDLNGWSRTNTIVSAARSDAVMRLLAPQIAACMVPWVVRYVDEELLEEAMSVLIAFAEDKTFNETNVVLGELSFASQVASAADDLLMYLSPESANKWSVRDVLKDQPNSRAMMLRHALKTACQTEKDDQSDAGKKRM